MYLDVSEVCKTLHKNHHFSSMISVVLLCNSNQCDTQWWWLSSNLNCNFLPGSIYSLLHHFSIMVSDCEAQVMIWSYSSWLLSSLLDCSRPETGFGLHDASMQMFLGSRLFGSFNHPACPIYCKIKSCFLLDSITQLRCSFNNNNIETPILGNRLKSFIFPWLNVK